MDDKPVTNGLFEFQRKFVSAMMVGSRPILATLMAFLVSSLLILTQSVNPLEAFAAMLKGSVGNIGALAATGVRATPLLFGGLSFVVAFRAGLFNVGVDGQLLVGAAAATAVAIQPLPLPPWLHVTLCLLAAAIGGALYALIPAYLRAYRGISEVVVTLMMNYIALNLISYLVLDGPLKRPGAWFPQSPDIMTTAWLPKLIERTSLHAGILVAIAIGLLLSFILRFTPFGFHVRMVGTNPNAAHYAGLDVKAYMLRVMLISGAIAGLAGASEVMGLRHALFENFSGGLGYDGISVGLLAAANPLGVFLAAFFFGALRAGAALMQQTVGIVTAMADVIQALTVFFVVGTGFVAVKTKKVKTPKNRCESPEEDVSRVHP